MEQSVDVPLQTSAAGVDQQKHLQDAINAIKAVDKAEIERLWGIIETLSLKLATSQALANKLEEQLKASSDPKPASETALQRQLAETNSKLSAANAEMQKLKARDAAWQFNLKMLISNPIAMLYVSGIDPVSEDVLKALIEGLPNEISNNPDVRNKVRTLHSSLAVGTRGSAQQEVQLQQQPPQPTKTKEKTDKTSTKATVAQTGRFAPQFIVKKSLRPPWLAAAAAAVNGQVILDETLSWPQKD